MSAIPEMFRRFPASELTQPQDQYLRRARVMVASESDAIDLSTLRFTFQTVQSDTPTPNICIIRVYNLAADTVAQVLKEYSRVTIEAGYLTGRFGVIFDGTIKQFRRGRESAIDTYLDIFGADGDGFHLFGVANASLPAGENSQKDQLGAVAEAGKEQGVTQDQNPYAVTGDVLPRGKVLFGMTALRMRDIARNTNTTWSIQNGKLTLIPRDGYLPGDIVDINARSGMVGMPEATEDGITVRILLNPDIKVGQRVHINNSAINQTLYRGQTSSGFPSQEAFGRGGFPRLDVFPYFARVTDDGIYRVLVIEHEGDTRGNQYYSNLICLAMDPSAIGADGAQGKPQDTIPDDGGGGGGGDAPPGGGGGGDAPPNGGVPLAARRGFNGGSPRAF